MWRKNLRAKASSKKEFYNKAQESLRRLPWCTCVSAVRASPVPSVVQKKNLNYKWGPATAEDPINATPLTEILLVCSPLPAYVWNRNMRINIIKVDAHVTAHAATQPRRPRHARGTKPCDDNTGELAKWSAHSPGYA